MIRATLAALLLSTGLVLGDDVFDLNEQAMSALDSGRPADAIQLLEKARGLDPDQPVLTRNLAYAHFLRGKALLEALSYDAAAADFRTAGELNPEEAGYRIHLAQLLLRHYRLDEAERVLRGVIEDHPDSHHAWLMLGDTLNLLDRLEDASAAYGRAAGSDDAKVAAFAREASTRNARQHDVEQDYLTSRSQSFVIRHPLRAQGPSYASRLIDVLERARAEVCNNLRHWPEQLTTVVLYPPEEFKRVTGAHDWVAGLFDRKIRLPIADVDRDRKQIEASFRHEYTHLIVSELHPACPTFLNEGLAQVMEHERGGGADRLVEWLDAQGADRNALPRVGELPLSFVELTDPVQVRQAYLLSYAFVDHVVSLHGTQAVTRWIEGLAAGRTLEAAYQSAARRSLGDEERLFRELIVSHR